jgi:rod shape-determining protein MreC
MLEFVRRNRVLISSGFFLLCSLGLLSANARQPGRIDPLGGAFLEVMAPFQRLTTGAVSSARDFWNGYVALVGAARENVGLRHEIREWERRAARLGELEVMNHRLKRLLDLQRRLPGKAIAAEVAARDASVWFQSLVLDKGSRHGLEPGMPVLAPEGVVGVVATTSAHAARVLLLTDPNSGIDVLVQRTRVRGIVSGRLEGAAILKYVGRGEDVQVGDRVMTSGLDGVFPKGMPVGRVTRVSRDEPGLFLYAEVVPAAEADRVEEVLVALPGGGTVAARESLLAPELMGPPDPASLGIHGPQPPPARGAQP